MSDASPEGFVIRRAAEGDREGVLALLEQVDSLHRDAMPWMFRQVDEPWSGDFFDEFTKTNDHRVFVAADGATQLLGTIFVFVRQVSKVPIVCPTLVGEIDSMVVDEASRGKGVGRALVETAVAWTKSMGATRTELGVYEFNQGAREFWQAMGFDTLSRRLIVHFS